MTKVLESSPWLYKHFIKEKLFVRERYFRKFQPLKNTSGRICVVPDGVMWRKYLKLWIQLNEKCTDSLVLILLESALELMDWRHVSLSVEREDGKKIAEAITFQEKKKLRKLIQDEKVIPFCDLCVREEECDEFNIFEYESMSIIERSGAALLRAGRMIGMNSRVMLIVESEEPYKIESEGKNVANLDTFLHYIFQSNLISKDDFDEIEMTKLGCVESYEKRNFTETVNKLEAGSYISDNEIKIGIRNGLLIKGKLDVMKENAKEGFALTSKGRFFLNDREGHFNRALHQDFVIVKPLPENQWGSPVGRRRLIHNINTEDLDESENVGPPVPSAVVVAITNQSRRIYVATLVDKPTLDERVINVVPMDPRIPKIRIQTKNWQKFQNKRLLVEIDNWDKNSTYPHGHCINILGTIGDLETEINCLLREQEIEFTPFSVGATASLPPEGFLWRVPEYEISSRSDLRQTHHIFSVDPEGCQDIDDAMHVRILSNGDVEVGVHIADVTYFVHHESELDKEAQIRATTFYLVDRRFDMLPTLLSSNLCSLHGNKDRLAVSVIWTLSPDFEHIKSTWFGRTVIHNIQAMTYGQAHNILNDKPPDDPLKPQAPPLTAGNPVNKKSIPKLKDDLSTLTLMARKFKRKREDIGGAIDLSSKDLGNELKFTLDENGNPKRVSMKKDLEIHHTIAELMILANRSVAEKIHEKFPDSSLLRTHRSVVQSKFEDLENALKAGGIAFDGTSNLSLAQSLRNARQKGQGKEALSALWQSLATRAMSEALYVCAGQSESDGDLSHYGLGIEKYTHFTSPIRRYADVVVHKQLLAALTNKTSEVSTIFSPDVFTQRTSILSIPNSNTISIMKGEGLKENGMRVDKSVDSFTPSSKNENNYNMSSHDREESSFHFPYSCVEISRICEVLNTQNRRAKYSSVNCQKLFLSLFFKNHTETEKAVITDLKANGLVVFVPKFDMKGPVYFKDIQGAVQIDPAFAGLPYNSGLDATLGFSFRRNCRRFPNGKVELNDDTTDKSNW
eukprot:CAMPEP_0194144058 /NCGR_PEP_ID=MMETSP0152-20130528/13144_1 /TAXON_ID=1049557 /ORGANISM="Thalassiothrix antarctica, Strain L6-D1" /LENGTH=1021 /DNA_ID=CAMNT_0038843741 /DNA_START=77 /DNA_END=3139 /DNA_ORIENTATION=+